ncbi:VOC family protein [Sulfobacillus harzensis]|uniref:VOC family protein n=1 Tax=Sulfobacillus harzensis TaxID=2729629 RepID=A0A7Y0L6K2_9FIRM|nr:VOC family protein [Sulfobacillus harzensis]NMP24222.1 VOC family protein [Sulfobacillus harzensis]
MLKRIAEVTYFVPDLDAAWAFLRDVANARLHFKALGLIQVEVGESLVSLHPADEKGSAGPGGQVAYWQVDNLNDAIQAFQDRGGHLYRGPIKGVDGPQVAQVQDPWGNLWGLLQS